MFRNARVYGTVGAMRDMLAGHHDDALIINVLWIESYSAAPQQFRWYNVLAPGRYSPGESKLECEEAALDFLDSGRFAEAMPAPTGVTVRLWADSEEDRWLPESVPHDA